WVSVALSELDRELAAQHDGKPFTVQTDGGDFRLRLLDVGDRYGAYYNDVANRLLWFTLHGLWGEPYEPSGAGWREPWERAYVPVNDLVADAVADAAENGAEVFLQDYHLTVAPGFVRERLPRAPILQYVHTPWPAPALLRRLPDAMTREILRALLSADVVGFSSPAWCRAFRHCAVELLGAASHGDVVEHAGGRTVVADFVLGVDADALRESAREPATQAAAARLEAELDGRRLILRVDRTDLSKNILRGLLAYELLLERHPEHRGRVWHYAHLNPSRQSVPEYQRYLAACQDAAARIQDRFGERAVRLFVGDDYATAVAALRRYDVLLANPVTDGTNLVAKEGPVLNAREGALVLSRNAGAADVLHGGALVINPYDVEETADALHRALRMPTRERTERAALLRQAAVVGAPHEWFHAQRQLLRAVVARRR
ncbi:MAG TPA: trehalose-6-phosphate synthase, partial [Egibacteraceae bacterium]|nr:trehalose-6-phosphate synthase [Egibacteraceae bacterium]